MRCTVSWDIETCSLTQLKLAPNLLSLKAEREGYQVLDTAGFTEY